MAQSIVSMVWSTQPSAAMRSSHMTGNGNVWKTMEGQGSWLSSINKWTKENWSTQERKVELL